MTGEIDALGALTTAGLAASTIDDSTRHTSGTGTAHFPETGHGHATCANCGTVLVGEYCHACGQMGHVHRSVAHIFEEFLHGLYHFDSKAWRTLPLLVFRPGKLTWDYVHGKRARYIAPLALFLLSIFLMFFVFGMIGGPGISGAMDKASSNTASAELGAEIAKTERQLAAAKAAGKPAEDVRSLELELSAKRGALGFATGSLAAAGSGVPQRWQDRLSDAVRSGKETVNLGNATIDARVREALLNPDFALYKIEQKAYKLSFLLIPLSLPTLWLMFFWRRDVRTYDHVIFALYSLSFMSLLFIAVALLLRMGGALSAAGGFLLFVPPIHIYAQLKGGYRLGRFGALVRAAILSVASVITLTLFAALIVVVGLAD